MKNFREKYNNNQHHISLMIQITKEMLPSFRIVAFYHTSSNEVVSDSVWVDVTDTCIGKVRDSKRMYEVLANKLNKLCMIL